MTAFRQTAALEAADCEVRSDDLTRKLYATDASHYQLEPAAVAFPRNAGQAGSVIRAAADAGIPVIPRGAGTGLAGGAIGEGLIVDLARHNRGISGFDRERRTVRVGAGVVLDQLNDFLRPHGLCFGPDVATSSRATIGGMIANNSSGAHTPRYGVTRDHVRELELVLADGSVVRCGPQCDSLGKQRRIVEALATRHAAEIAARRPPGLRKRWPAYAVERCLSGPVNLNDILCGSEGTLGAIASAELGVVPLPARKGLALLFFDSVAEAMLASTSLLDLDPAAIEHVDRPLLDQTRGQIRFQAARDLLGLDESPCESILAVEFFDDIEDKLGEVEAKRLAKRFLLVREPARAALFWGMRKAGLSLLTGMAGDAKPVTLIEDAAVMPRRLPEYYGALRGILDRRGLEASFYGHAASGLLHVRPVLNLHTADGVRAFRELAGEVFALVREFKGSAAAEHGVGITHTEYMREQLGESLFGVMSEIKRSFDPRNVFNPGKIVGDGRYRIDRNLRIDPGERTLPFEPTISFRAKDGSFLRNLDQCNGCGGCTKGTPVMCPTYLATGEEGMSTRGRANLIRAVIEGRAVSTGDGLASDALDYALSNCLSCKACATECPSNVNLPLLKAELQHARIRRDGLTLRERLFGNPDALGRAGCAWPGLANRLLASPLSRGLARRLLGIAPQRRLPPYARERFDRWFSRRGRGRGPGSRGRVLLWDDTFVRYHHPEIGRAAVRVLEAAGHEVVLAQGRVCCGRPAFSQGNVDDARRLGRHNIALMRSGGDRVPIVFLEPSCWSMFSEDYGELGIPGADEVSSRSFLFEQHVDALLERNPDALAFRGGPAHVALHAHCHAKSMLATEFMARLARRLPDSSVEALDSGCCGMAGGFGMLESKYELSRKIADPLVDSLNAMPAGTSVVASGTSCRHQIAEFSGTHPVHMAELLADALGPDTE